jgi:hypothetical protein
MVFVALIRQNFENSPTLLLIVGIKKYTAATWTVYRGVDKSLARPTSRCILFDGENISFDASLVIYIVLYK